MKNGRLYNLEHCTYTCKYHIVFTPKYRGKVLQDEYTKTELKRLFKMVCQWKGFHIHAWHIGDEHIHLVVTIPPKYSVSYAIQLLKGKSSAWIKKRTKKFPVGSLWQRGYYASTVGVNEWQVRNYVNYQQQYQVTFTPLPFPDQPNLK